MIRTQFPALIQTRLVRPSPAKKLPGVFSVLKRVAPGGVEKPTASEQLTALKKIEYQKAMKYSLSPSGVTAIPPLSTLDNPPVQAHVYATNPRKDATTPKISISSAFSTLVNAGIFSQVANAPKPVVQNNTGQNASDGYVNKAVPSPVATTPDAVAIANASGTPTAGVDGENQQAGLNWVAILILGGVAFSLIGK